MCAPTHSCQRAATSSLLLPSSSSSPWWTESPAFSRRRDDLLLSESLELLYACPALRSPGSTRVREGRAREFATLSSSFNLRATRATSPRSTVARVETRLWTRDAAATHAQSDFAVPLIPRESSRPDSAHAALPRRRRLRRRPPRSRRDRRAHSRRRAFTRLVHSGTRASEEEEATVKWGAPLAAAMARLGRQGRRHCPRHQTKECAPPLCLAEVTYSRSTSPTVVQLDKLHAKHLLPGFKDRTAEEREIEALATSITAVSLAPPSSVHTKPGH